jgi:hypothetical protein
MFVVALKVEIQGGSLSPVAMPSTSHSASSEAPELLLLLPLPLPLLPLLLLEALAGMTPAQRAI